MSGPLPRFFIGKCNTHDEGALGQFERAVLVACAMDLSSDKIELVCDTEADDLFYHAWSGAHRISPGRSAEERQQMIMSSDPPIRCAFFMRGGKYAMEEMELCAKRGIPVVCFCSNGKDFVAGYELTDGWTSWFPSQTLLLPSAAKPTAKAEFNAITANLTKAIKKQFNV